MHVHKYRLQHRAFLAEGADLVVAGLAAGHRPQVVFLLEGSHAEAELPSLSGGPTLPITLVSRRVAERISSLEAPPPVMAVFPALESPPLESLAGPALLALYADHIADPGNLGTLLRSAAAFGATCVLTSPASVDVLSPKVVRASMGTVFHVPVYTGHLLRRALTALAPARAYGLVAHGGADLGVAPLRRPAVVCVGAERAGLSDEVLEAAHERLTIPLAPGAGGVESLNAGVAGAIALYEFARRTGGIPTPER